MALWMTRRARDVIDIGPIRVSLVSNIDGEIRIAVDAPKEMKIVVGTLADMPHYTGAVHAGGLKCCRE